MVKTLGIDEAGRGPVIGPMVMAGTITTPEIEEELKALGVRDSKLIFPAKRKQLFEVVKEKVIAYEIIVVSPKEIDAALNNPELNLNKLEAVTSAKIINELKGKADQVMLDSPTNTPAPYIEFVQGLLKEKIIVKAETKADVNYPSVSAASILAKVTRDSLIEDLEEAAKKVVGNQEVGSGYPSDPKTKEFLAKYYDKLDSIEGGFFRKTWASWKNIAKAKNQKGLGEF